MARASFKIAPGIRISASSRGIRTSVGSSKARVSFGSGGTYTSAKVGGVRVSSSRSSSSGNHRPSASSGGSSRPSLAQLERVEKAAAAEAQINELAALERSLVTIHHEEFPLARPREVSPPPPVEFPQILDHMTQQALAGIGVFKFAERKAAKLRAEQAAHAEAARLQSEWHRLYELHCEQAQQDWANLMEHDPETVMAALEEAFADNASEATCVDAGVEDGARYATIVIVFGSAQMVPERTPSVTPSGKPTTKKRTKGDRNALYVSALGSTVLATVKEGLAVAPRVEQFRVVVIRRDTAAATPADFVAPIYSGTFKRAPLQGLPWQQIDPVAALLTAEDAAFVRKGAAGEVMPVSVEDAGLAELVEKFRPLVMNK